MPHFNSRDRCSTGPFLDAPLRLTLRSRVATTRVIIIGGGLAGSEAAWQAARRGLRVDLHEMRPVRTTPVHATRSEEHTSELQSRGHLVCRLLLEKKKATMKILPSDFLHAHR